MGNDEWDALEHYLRAGAEIRPEAHTDEVTQQIAAVIRTSSIEEAPT